MRIFPNNVYFSRRPAWRGVCFSIVFCFLAVVLVNVLEEDSAFLRLKNCGISKALSCRVGGVAKIKTDHPLAMAVDRSSLVVFYLTTQGLDAGLLSTPRPSGIAYPSGTECPGRVHLFCIGVPYT